jgi:hypothetical protein
MLPTRIKSMRLARNVCFMLTAGGLFEGGLFDDAPLPPEVPAVETSSIQELEEPEKPPEEAAAHDSDDDMGDHFGGPPSVGGQR